MTRTRVRRTSLPNHDSLHHENEPYVHTKRPQLSDPPAALARRSPEISAAMPARPETPPPVGMAKSAPATYPAIRYHSTPIKRKACSIPLALLPMDGGSGSTGKRRRLTSQVSPLLHEELYGRWYSYAYFLADFVHHGPWALSDERAINSLALLSQATPTKGITYDPTNDSYSCTPPGFVDAVFPDWFCDFGNTILRVSQVNAGVDHNSTAHSAIGNIGAILPMVGDSALLADITNYEPTAQCPNEHMQRGPTSGSPDTKSNERRQNGLNPGLPGTNKSPSGPGELSWVSCRTSTLHGLGKPQIRPDFVLTSNSIETTWSNILVVGEHHSTGKTEETAKLQLASYVEQVFIAQPFRLAIIGILTSNTSPTLRLWRFDRAGAVGSLKLNYSSTASPGDLTAVVQCLYSLATTQLQGTWFHTKSVSWIGPKQPDWCTVGPTNQEHAKERVFLNEKIFTAGGLASRGTTVWKGILKGTGKVVAVKYSWQSTKRTSEAKNYSVAHSKGVVGLPELVSHDEYESVSTNVRRGVTSCTLCDPHNPTSAEKSAVDAYALSAIGCDRTFTRLVLGTVGRPISDSSLSALEIARSLLAGVIAHASLFFQCGILHRDVSINNIIAIPSPLATVPSTPPTIDGQFLYTPGTDLYGCIIDLDYAIVVTEQNTSGIPERTGTYPFIAIDILRGTATHRYRHDLESFLYVLLWVACYPVVASQSTARPASPHDKRKRERWPPHDPLCAWSCESELTVAAIKFSNIVGQEDIFEELLERFRPGFETFKLAAREIRLALWEFHDTGICTLQTESPGTEVGLAGERQGRARARGSKKPKGLGAEDVRTGVSNWVGFCDLKAILEELVNGLEEEATGTNDPSTDDL